MKLIIDILNETETNVEDLLPTPAKISAMEDLCETIVFDVYADDEDVLEINEENGDSERCNSPEQGSENQSQSLLSFRKSWPGKQTTLETLPVKSQGRYNMYFF